MRWKKRTKKRGDRTRMIYSLLNKPDHKFTPSGTPYINTYQEEIKDGRMTLTKTGQTNVYERIQADLESCKIENILHAVAMGDLNALNQREATYCDATTMPKNLMEAQNLVLRMKDEFYKMPMEVRKEFGNSPDTYVEEMGTKEFFEKMAPYNEKIAAISKEKSMKEYEKKVAEGAKLNIDIERETMRQKGATTNEQK